MVLFWLSDWQIKKINVFLNEISAILFYLSCEVGIVLERFSFLLTDLSLHFSEIVLIY